LDETNGGSSLGDLINAITFDPFGVGDVVLPEQLLATFSENVVTDGGNLVTDLDTAAADALVQTLLGVGPNAFTNGGYTPDNIVSGDFASNLTNILLVPGVRFEQEVVPEPASMAIWASFAAVGAFGAYRRRRAAKKASA
jgi:hypothetical protein